MTLKPNEKKRAKARVFRTPMDEPSEARPGGGAGQTTLDIEVGPCFRTGSAIEVTETKARLKVMLRKKASSSVQLQRVRGD